MNLSQALLDIDLRFAFADLVLVLAVANLPDYEDLVAFVQVQPCCLLAPDHNAMPFGAGLPLLGVRLLPGGGCRNRQHRIAIPVTLLSLGICSEESNQLCFVCFDHVKISFLCFLTAPPALSRSRIQNQ